LKKISKKFTISRLPQALTNENSKTLLPNSSLATTHELASSVSNAGGLGSLALSWKDLELTKGFIRKTKKLTDKPFAVNLVLDFEQEERLRYRFLNDYIISIFGANG
jgi:hypothetical protein